MRLTHVSKWCLIRRNKLPGGAAWLHISACHSLWAQRLLSAGLTAMLWMMSPAVPQQQENGCPPCRRCRVERCNFAASYQLSASVNNIIRANQCYIKHYINVRAAAPFWERRPWCCDTLLSLIMDNTPGPSNPFTPWKISLVCLPPGLSYI